MTEMGQMAINDFFYWEWDLTSASDYGAKCLCCLDGQTEAVALCVPIGGAY
jgi:hypothetical protein